MKMPSADDGEHAERRRGHEDRDVRPQLDAEEDDADEQGQRNRHEGDDHAGERAPEEEREERGRA